MSPTNHPGKPWLNPPDPDAPWPTEEQVAKAMGPQKLTAAKTPSQKTLDADIQGIAGSLQEAEVETIVVIGINSKGQILSLYRAGDEFQPYALIGALEAMKSQLLSEIQTHSKGEAK